MKNEKKITIDSSYSGGINKVFLGNAIEPDCGEYATSHVVAGVILNEPRRNFAYKIGNYALVFTKDARANVFVEIRPLKKEEQK